MDLQATYARYNKLYFGGELPDMPVRWGMTHSENAAEFWHEPMQIVIHPVIKRCGLFKYARLLLVHEMAHVKLRDRRIKDHGRVFQAEMRRLASIPSLTKLL